MNRHELCHERRPEARRSRFALGSAREAYVRKAVTWFLATCLAIAGPASVPHALAQAETRTSGDSSALGDRAFSVLQQARASIDRTRFDVEALAFDLAFEEPRTIIDWVRSHIAFEPYRGVLRGAGGVLQSAAGNTLDQSLLLATLLNDSGLEARIVRTTLETELASLLLDAVDLDGSSPPAVGSDVVAVWLDHVEAFGRVFDLSPAETRERLDELASEASASRAQSGSRRFDVELVASEANAVLEAVRPIADDWSASEDEAHEALLDDTRDYFWVQYRLRDEAWVDAHVVGEVSADEFAGIDVEDEYTSSVPEHLLHRFRFQAFVEVRTGDELRVEAVMDPWERPVANLVAVPLSYSSHPTSMGDLARFDSPFDVLDDVQFFAPVWNDAVADGGLFFDAWGNLVDPDVAEQAAAGVFATVGRGFAQALGAVGGDAAVPVVTAHFIEYTFIDVDGREDVHRRYLYDGFARVRASFEAGAASVSDVEFDHNAVSMSLYDSVTFMIASGSFAPDAVLDAGLAAMLDARGAIDGLAGMEGPDAPLPAVSSSSAGSAATLMALFSDLDSIASSFENGRTYRPAPALVAYEQGIDHVDGEWRLHHGVDVVADPRRFVRRVEGRYVLDPTMRVLSGVWTTLVELRHLEAIVHGIGAHDGSDRDVSSVFGRLTFSDGELPLVITSIGEVSEYWEHIPPSAGRAVIDDLERGYVVVVPSLRPPSEAFAWWRVDPFTGATLGRLENGRGGVLWEYVKTWFAGFTVAMSACLMTSWAARYLVLAATGGEGDVKSVVKPRDFIRCAAFGVSVATFRANVIAPKVGLQAGAGPSGVVYSFRGINTFDTSALGLGVAFVVGLLGEFLVPADWP